MHIRHVRAFRSIDDSVCDDAMVASDRDASVEAAIAYDNNGGVEAIIRVLVDPADCVFNSGLFGITSW